MMVLIILRDSKPYFKKTLKNTSQYDLLTKEVLGYVFNDIRIFELFVNDLIIMCRKWPLGP